MFATKVPIRAARSATQQITANNACLSCLATARQQPGHQRRQSSSKTSWPPSPPDDSAAGAAKTAPTAKAEKAREQVQEVQVPPAAARPSSKGRTRATFTNTSDSRKGTKTSRDKKSKDTTPGTGTTGEEVDHFASLPRVPSVQDLGDRGSLRPVNFFALHRPLSLSHTFPQPSSPEDFSQIFASASSSDPWADGNSAERRPEDVIYTLHNTLSPAGATAEEEGVRWEVLTESQSHGNNDGGIKHLDPTQAPTRLKSLEELVAQFKPFAAPPPPQPFVDATPGSPQVKKAKKEARKTFTATITVTESTDANGQKTYSASSSPIVRLPEPSASSSSLPQTRRQRATALRQHPILLTSPFRHLPANAVRIPPSGLRGGRVRDRMLLISVKRQRKLKMKKHKYKKLMKRTRTLRRKLDRA